MVGLSQRWLLLPAQDRHGPAPFQNQHPQGVWDGWPHAYLFSGMRPKFSCLKNRFMPLTYSQSLIALGKMFPSQVRKRVMTSMSQG